MAGRGIVIVVQVVIPKQLLSGPDVAQGEDKRAVLDLIHFAVRITRMVQVCADPLAVNNRLAIFQTIEVGARRVIVEPVSLLGSNTRTAILGEAGAFADRGIGEHPRRMNAGGRESTG